MAAASTIADEFKEHLSWNGFLQFVVFYLIIVNGWLLYSHHISSRFQDASLAHSLILFVYLLGFGMCIVNASLDHASAFCIGGILMRASVLIMLASISLCIPRARYMAGLLAGIICLAMLGLSLPVIWPDNTTVARVGLWFTALLEFCAEMGMIYSLPGNRLVPVNIDQSKERLGALVLVMLGETVLSVTITYRELKQEQEGEQHDSYYYWVLGLSFLLIFMFTLLFFHMQPPPHEHAFRRSRTHGTLALVAHKVLGLALLTVGVSVKLVVEAVMDPNEEVPPFTSQLMGCGVGAALLTLFLIRYLHYGNKSEFYIGEKLVKRGADAQVDRIVQIWWWTVGVAGFIPFLMLSVTNGHALFATAFYAGLVFLLCILETSYTHFFGKRLSENAHPTKKHHPILSSKDASKEIKSLLSSYQAAHSHS